MSRRKLMSKQIPFVFFDKICEICREERFELVVLGYCTCGEKNMVKMKCNEISEKGQVSPTLIQP